MTIDAPRPPPLASSSALAEELLAAPRHLVRFYDGDGQLADTVASFLAEGLALGDEQVVAVATAAHLELFRDRLAGGGVDVDGALATGRLLFVDAHQALQALLRDGRPDPAAFEAQVTPLVGAASPTERPRRRLYGEMVDLLWQRGDRAAALQLEELWNRCQERYAFTILCTYSLTSFAGSPVAVHQICHAHTHVVSDAGGGLQLEPTVSPHHARRLAREVAEREQIERALRASLAEVRRKEEELRRSDEELRQREEQLRTVTDALPTLISFVDADGRYRFVNASYQRWFGHPASEVVGRTVEDVVGTAAFRTIEPYLRRALAGETVRWEGEVAYRDGGPRAVEVTYLPQRAADGSVHGYVGLVADISERRDFERFRAATAGRAEQLLRITAALADAVTTEQVLTAVVDQLADAVGASSAGLWLLDAGGGAARLVRSVGYSEAGRQQMAAMRLDAEPSLPIVDAIRRGHPLWIPSQAALLRAYPHLHGMVTGGAGYRIACLPLGSEGRTIGGLGITQEHERELTDDDRDFLLLVARYASQALERLRLLEDNVGARTRAEQLQRFADSVVSAERVEDVFESALDAIAEALATPRAAILLFDDHDVMRFRAWRELSDVYRGAVEGHSPWPRDVANPRPVVVEDVLTDATLAELRPVLEREGIGSLAFIPLVTRGRLIGKFMLYHPRAHAYSSAELDLAVAIANHLASVAARFAAIAQLEETIRHNELFAGVLAHDLRNPLGAMMTAAQILLMRQEGESDRQIRPLGRILASGQRMTRMIDQLLDFTRARVGGGIEVRPRDCNLADLCAQAIGELEMANPEWKIEHGVLGDLDGSWDPDRLLQIISNLIGNAGQHGDVEAGILVLVDGRAADRVSLRVHNKGAIPPALLPGLFDPFRATRHRRDHSRGLGLGLFIVKELVRAHGGTVEVSSTETAGTTFTLALPRQAAASRVEAAAVPA